MTEDTSATELLAIERLDKFVRTLETSRRVFEKNVGVSNGYICNQLKRKGSISSDILERIVLSYPEINLTWLLTGHRHIVPRNTGPTYLTPEIEKQVLKETT